MDTPPRLNFVGCGRAARVLGSLWKTHGVFELGEVLTRSRSSAEAAVTAMGGGTPIAHVSELGPADLILIGTPDDQIETTSSRLLEHYPGKPGTIVFHLSGALSAADTFGVMSSGWISASCHPLCSFADHDSAIATFGGIWCGFEGNDEALAVLENAFRRIEARTFRIDPKRKLVYHAGSVMASNYLNALLDAALRCFDAAGIEPQTARDLIAPLATNTLSNIIKSSPGAALTGPIRRGDDQTVAREQTALDNLDELLAATYRTLGRSTIHLAASSGALDKNSRARLVRALAETEPGQETL